MPVIAIIPARGGSKGIPRKNLLPLAGKPLLAHSILQARQTPTITRVVVSTDDQEIAAVAREWDAEVILRPSEISGDRASSESALLHALDFLKHKEGYDPGFVVFLQATSPIRRPGEIQAAIEALRRENADSLFSACRVEGFTWRLRNGSVAPVNYDPAKRPLRQELLEEIWEENGSLYIFKPFVLREFNSRLGGKIVLHPMSRLDSFQIDEPGDFELIEALMAYQNTGLKEEAGKQKAKSEESSLLRASSLDSNSSFSSPASSVSKIKLLVLDFDGVLTDNRVIVGQDGHEAVVCSRGDGLGIEMVRAAGVEVVVISKEKNPVVAARCRKLAVECIQGCDEKLAALIEKAGRGGLKRDEIAYVGNDINDLECLRWVGLPVAVCDAAPEVLAIAKLATTKPGGFGAVREICDLLVKNFIGNKTKQ
jgi:N-acylneuraminate cytidylyltransferase